jgi:serine/threonine-protein phosphatase PGAM5
MMMMFRGLHPPRHRHFPGGILVGSVAALLWHSSRTDGRRDPSRAEESRDPATAATTQHFEEPLLQTKKDQDHTKKRRPAATDHHRGSGVPKEFRPLLRKHDYPAWDYDWDGLHEQWTTRQNNNKKQKNQALSGRGSSSATTRHILLVRHGQYEQQYDNDAQQVLTSLGRRQAAYTGERLAQMMQVHDTTPLPPTSPSVTCRLVGLHVSGMKRAQETADIIADYLLLSPSDDIIDLPSGAGSVTSGLACDVRTPPDDLLNEGLPAPIIPVRDDVGTLSSQVAAIAESSDRIERAFRKYIHRADCSSSNSNDDVDDDDDEPDNDDDGTEVEREQEMDTHEFEIIVCHANVIRYLLLRALQLPPEAWLRFSLFNCSISYIMIQPNGTVSARLIGDTGHIPYDETTFSGSYGYNWKTPGST